MTCEEIKKQLDKVTRELKKKDADIFRLLLNRENLLHELDKKNKTHLVRAKETT